MTIPEMLCNGFFGCSGAPAWWTVGLIALLAIGALVFTLQYRLSEKH